jgi:hypothetical protein
VIFLYFGGFFVLEPFGLFHLLKSLTDTLSQNQEPPPAEPEPAPPSAEPEPPTKEQDNACVEFLAMHEARAKRTRRK